MSDLSDEFIKEALDWIAFNDNMNETTKASILKKVKILYPKPYQEWLRENEHLIKKWNISA